MNEPKELQEIFVTHQEIFEAHRRWMESKGEEGRKAYLLGADLRGVDLEGAYLQEAKLQGVKLQGADLRNTILQGADFRGANLMDATGLTRGQIQSVVMDEKTRVPSLFL